MLSVMLSHRLPLTEGIVKNATQALFENSVHLAGAPAPGASLHPVEVLVSWI